jgi:hypothetical protein
LLRSTVGGLIALMASGCTDSGSDLGGSRSFERSIALEDVAETSANVSLGDLDGDGHLDVVLVKGRHWPLLDLVLMGDGAGGFEPARPVGGTPDRSYSGVLVDLDGDGDLDLVVSNDDPDPKIVHLNVGDGHFEVGSTFGLPEWSTRHIGIHHLDRDSLPDVVLANRTGDDSGFNYVCFGAPQGRFQDPCYGFSRESATTITAADLNGDGSLDLIVPHRDGGQGHIYLNDGSGGFEDRAPFGPPDAEIRAAKAADFDADGILDLAVIDERRGPAVYRGQPGGTFATPVPLGETRARPYAIEVADVDGNGRPDVIVGYVEARPVVFFNDAPTGFVPVEFGDSEGVAYGFAVGDVDEDGFLDIGMARSGARNMMYFGAPG